MSWVRVVLAVAVAAVTACSRGSSPARAEAAAVPATYYLALAVR